MAEPRLLDFAVVESELRAQRAILDERTCRFEARVAGLERAIDKAEHEQAQRNEAANGLRAQLGEQAATLLPRLEAEANFVALRALIDRLRDELVKATDGHFTANREMIERVREDFRRGDEQLRTEIVELREYRSEGTGSHKREAELTGRALSQATIAIAVLALGMSAFDLWSRR